MMKQEDVNSVISARKLVTKSGDEINKENISGIGIDRDGNFIIIVIEFNNTYMTAYRIIDNDNNKNYLMVDQIRTVSFTSKSYDILMEVINFMMLFTEFGKII